MTKMGLSMINGMGIINTTAYFLNGVSKGIPQEHGQTTITTFVNAINTDDKAAFVSIMTNAEVSHSSKTTDTIMASLSFPVGATYIDVNSAWEAVHGTKINISCDIYSAGMFAAAPVQIQFAAVEQMRIPEPNKIDDLPNVQYQSSIIRMEFEAGSNNAIIPRTTKILLKSVEFFWDF